MGTKPDGILMIPINNVIALTNGRYGRRAVLNTSWSEHMIGYLTGNNVVELELNQGKGWSGTDIRFLALLPGLRSFEIIDLNIGDVEPIHFLHKLKSLQVTTYCPTAIDFAAFPELESCALEWRPGAISLFRCLNLKELFVNRYDRKSVALFSNLVNLESLAILSAPIEDLRGLSALTKLRSLRLGNLKRLNSLAGIEELARLEELEVHTCRRVASIKEVGLLSRLRKLHLNNDGNIDSLTPLDNLESLESVLFYESTNIVDGDLSPLLRQRHLSRVSFRNRRHYSHRREDFGAAYTR
jgi:Leucine-rich repeat (LRR) protein